MKKPSCARNSLAASATLSSPVSARSESLPVFHLRRSFSKHQTNGCFLTTALSKWYSFLELYPWWCHRGQSQVSALLWENCFVFSPLWICPVWRRRHWFWQQAKTERDAVYTRMNLMFSGDWVFLELLIVCSFHTWGKKCEKRWSTGSRLQLLLFGSKEADCFRKTNSSTLTTLNRSLARWMCIGEGKAALWSLCK